MRIPDYQKQFTLFIVVVLTLSSIVFLGCESQQKKDIRLQKQKEEQKKTEEESNKELSEAFYRKEAVLLSLKYNVDEQKVFDILTKEYGILYSNPEQFVDSLFGKGTRERIEKYAQQYDIPTNIIASILIDYETIQQSSD